MKKSRTAWIALVMSAVASVLTFSRSTYLGCFGSGVIYAVIQKKWVWLCIGVVASGALIAVTTSDNQSYSILRRETALARIGSWEDGVRLIQHAGVFGYGFDMLRSVNEPGFGEKNDHTISHATAGIDNSVLFIIATTGIPGIMAFIWMIFSIYVVALRNMRLRPWLLLYMSAVLIHSFFVHSLFTPWITAGIVLLYQDSNSDQAIIHTNTKKP
jgi:O-antigen ligase